MFEDGIAAERMTVALPILVVAGRETDQRQGEGGASAQTGKTGPRGAPGRPRNLPGETDGEEAQAGARVRALALMPKATPAAIAADAIAPRDPVCSPRTTPTRLSSSEQEATNRSFWRRWLP